jgi:hypothetical protein
MTCDEVCKEIEKRTGSKMLQSYTVQNQLDKENTMNWLKKLFNRKPLKLPPGYGLETNGILWRYTYPSGWTSICEYSSKKKAIKRAWSSAGAANKRKDYIWVKVNTDE